MDEDRLIRCYSCHGLFFQSSASVFDVNEDEWGDGVIRQSFCLKCATDIAKLSGVEPEPPWK